MFIPLAPTTSTTSTPSSPSLSTSPLDDGITTVKHCIYIYTNLNPRTNATTKMYHCNWQDNIKCQSHCIYTSTCPYRCCPEICGYCSRGNSYTQRSKINLYARTSEKNTKGSRESTSPPSAGTSLAQSVFAGIPSISRRPYPSFVTHSNYHDGQFHHYYPPEIPNPISQSPTTSAPKTTHSAGMNTGQTSTMTSNTSSTATATSTSGSNTVPTIAREAHRSHTVFAPIDLVESLTKTNHLLVADMKSELQSMNNQLSTQSTEI